MKIDVQNKDPLTIVDISGKVTINNTSELRSAFEKLIDEGHRTFVMDLLDVPWMDSAAIGQVIGCHRRALEVEGNVKLVLNKKAHDLFTFMQLHKVFDMFEDREAALASFA